jgi:hypothetical protein
MKLGEYFFSLTQVGAGSTPIAMINDTLELTWNLFAYLSYHVQLRERGKWGNIGAVLA